MWKNTTKRALFTCQLATTFTDQYPLMKNISIILVATIALIFIYGCEKDEKPYVPVERCPDLTRNMDTINKYIHGTWQWLEEKRYDRYKNEYVYFTPKTPGWYNLSISLSGDTIRFFKNNIPDSVYRFKIQRELEITNYPTDSLPVIAYYSFYNGVIRNYVPIMMCKKQMLLQYQFDSDIAGEDVYQRRY